MPGSMEQRGIKRIGVYNMNKHKSWKRIALLLAVLLAVTCMQATAFASSVPTNERDGSKIEEIDLFWVTPDSSKANNGVSTPNDILTDNTFLFLATAGEADVEMKYQFEIAFSGQYDYAPGDIRIILPAQVWHTRAYDEDGKGVVDPDQLMGYVRLPVPEAPKETADFNYQKIGDNYVLTNTKTISATSRATFQVSICGLAPEDIVDMSISDPITVRCEVTTNQGNTIELTSDEITAQVDTIAKITGTEKGGQLYYKNVASTLPAVMAANLPEGTTADDYYIVSWYTYIFHEANQPFSLQLDDTCGTVFEYVLDDEGNYVLDDEGKRMMTQLDVETIFLGSTSHPGQLVDTGDVDFTTAVQTNEYIPTNVEPYRDTVRLWSAYPKDQFPPIPETVDPQRYFWFPNDVEWTLVETDADPSSTEGFAAAADGQYTTTAQDNALERLRAQWLLPAVPPAWGDVPSNFWFNKWTEEYHYDYDYGFGLNQLLEDEPTTMTFHLRTEGHGYGLTKEPGAENIPENYGWLGWRQTTEDFDTFWEESAVPLTEEDFEIVSMKVPDPKGYVYGIWKKWNAEKQDYDYYYAYGIDRNRPIPDLVIEYQLEGGDEWLPAAVARWGSDGLSENTGFVFEEVQPGITTDGRTVYFPENTTDVRHSYVSNVFGGRCMTERNLTGGWRWDVYLDINLKPSDRVKEIANFLVKNVDVIDSEFRNDAKMYVDAYVGANEDGTPNAGTPGYTTIYDHSIASIKAAKYGVTLDKEVTYDPRMKADGGDNDAEMRRVTLHYAANLTEASNLDSKTTYREAVEAGVIHEETKGIYYDLLPEGVVPDLDSIRVSSGETVTARYTVDNYKNTGRILLVVELDMTPTLTMEHTGEAGTNTYKQWVEDTSRIEFDAYAGWDIIGDTGVNLTNYIAFETKVDTLYLDTMGSLVGQRGEPDDPRGGMNYTTPDMPDDIAAALTDLDPNTDENRFVYGKVDVNLNVETQMLTGYRKDVRDPLTAGEWTQGLINQEQVTVYEGHPYIYRLWVKSSPSTTTSDIIMFDTIENYIIPDPSGSEQDATKVPYFEDVQQKKTWQGDWENKGQWRGKLASVDLSNFIAMEAAPVLYYSTVPGLQFGDTDKPMSNPDTVAFFNSGSYDLTDASIWQQAQLDENGMWVVPENLFGQISAVAVDARKKADGTSFILPEDTSVEGYLNMVAPDDNMDPDVWDAKGAYAHVMDGDGNPTKEVDWAAASADPANNMYAYNNTRLKCVQHATDQTGAQSSFMMIRNDFTRVGILPRIIHLEKVWDDTDNWDALRPDEITFAVERKAAGEDAYAPVMDADGQPLEITLTEEGEWKGQLVQIDIVDDRNIAYQYRFVEKDLPEGYTYTVTQIDETHYTARNVHERYTVDVSGAKEWNDNDDENGLRPESITVRLLRDGELIKTKVVKADENGQWNYSFGKLLKNEEGGREYVYTVEEEYVPKYTPTYENYTLIKNDLYPWGDLTVEKKLLGATAVSAEVEFTFDLTVIAEKTAEMEANGEEPTAILDEFDYEIFELAQDGETWESVSTGKITGSSSFTLKGNQKIIFRNLPSESTYKVTERKTPGFRLTEKVGDSGVIRSAQTSEAVFTNTYSASGETQLVAGKGQQGAAMKNGQHKFQIIDMNEDSATYGEAVRTGYTGTSESTQEELGQAILSSAVAHFGALNYTAADHGKTFAYKVVEVDMEKPGYTYDDTAYNVYVTVTDNGDGTMTVVAVDESGNDATSATGETMPFENEYEAHGEIAFKAWKTLQRRALEAGEFSFELYAYDPVANAAVGSALQTKQNDAEGLIEFDPVAFDQDDVSVDAENPAKYYFLVKEKVGTDATVIYSDEQYIYEVTVFDNGDGTLSFEEVVTTLEGNTAVPVFTNDLKTGGLSVKKTVESGANIPFTFKVKLTGEGLPQYLDGDLSGAQVTAAPATPTPAPVTTPRPVPTYDMPPLNDAVEPDTSRQYHATASELAGNAYAMLKDGTLTFFRSSDGKDPAGNLMPFVDNNNSCQVEESGTIYYIVDEAATSNVDRPWTMDSYGERSSITNVVMQDAIKPAHLYGFFKDLRNATTFEIAKLDTSNATNMQSMFYYCENVESLDLSTFDTSNVTDVNHMFYHCNNLADINTSSFNTENITNMSYFFAYCAVDTLDLSNFDTSNVNKMNAMFYECGNLSELLIGSFDTSNVTDMSWMFKGCSSIELLNLSHFNTEKVTTLAGLFSGCSNLLSADVTSFDTSNNTSLQSICEDCYDLTTLDVSGWDCTNVKAMTWAFSGCYDLVELDTRNWHCQNITHMQGTFEYCRSLQELYVSDWDVSSSYTFGDCFKACTNLRVLDVSNWELPTTGSTFLYGMFQSCGTQELVLDISNWDISRYESFEELFDDCDAKIIGLNSFLRQIDLEKIRDDGLDYFLSYIRCDDLDISCFDFTKLPNGYDSLNQSFYGPYISQITINDSLRATEISDFPSARNVNPYNGTWENVSTGEVLTNAQLFGEGNHGGTWTWHIPKYKINFDPGEGGGSMPSVTTAVRSDYKFGSSFYRHGYVVTHFTDEDGNAYTLNEGIATIPYLTYEEGDEITLTAQWAQRDTTVELTGGEFTFSIYAGETITFNGLPAGTTYQVSELTPDGWKIVAQENVSGVIKPVQIAQASFTNEKGLSEEVTVYPIAKKLLDGQPAQAGLFTFTLEDPQGNILETVTNGEGGFIVFQPITLTMEDLDGALSKNLFYKIREINKTDPTIDYDPLDYMEVRVKLTQSNGKLNAALEYYSNGTNKVSDPAFKNNTKPGHLKFSKEIEGATSSAQSQMFTFQVSFKNPDRTPWTGDAFGEVKQYKNNESTYLWANISTGTLTVKLKGGEYVKYKDIPAGVTYEVKEIDSLPGWETDGTVAAGKIAATQTAEHSFLNTYSASGVANISVNKTLIGRELEDGEFSFQLCEGNTVIAAATNDQNGNVSFPSITYDQEGTYNYVVVEVPGNDPNMIYSTQRVPVTVEVTDEDGEGNLTCEVTYPSAGKTFVNHLAPGSLSLIKIVESVHEEHKDANFTYPIYIYLSNPDGTPYVGYVYMDEALTIPYAVNGSLPGYFPHNMPGYLYGLPAGTRYQVVEMDLSSYGFTATYEGEVGTIESNTMAFVTITNSYATKAEHQLTGTKVLDGADLEEGQFSFQLYRVNEDGTETLVETVTNDAEGNFAFTKFTYTESDAGTYVYRIREVNDGQDGITYDTDVKEVTLEVVDNLMGNLTVAETLTDDNTLTFYNDFNDETDVTATKQWVGDEDHPETRVDIRVNLYKKLPGQEGTLVDQATIPADATGDALTVSWTQLPKYEEVDGTRVELVYYVTEEMLIPEGQPCLYTGKVSGSARNGFLLVNRYAAADVDVEAGKTLNGQELTEGMFTFVIENEEGDIVSAATNQADGSIVFDVLSFTMDDLTGVPYNADGSRSREINYILREENGEHPRYTYDETQYPFTVTLTESPNGDFSATSTLLPGDATFVNDVKTISFVVTKEWQNAEGGLITLTLYANGEKMDPQPEYTESNNVYTYANLPQYTEEGKAIVYAAKEKYMDGFMTIYQNVAPYTQETDMIYNGGTIVNRAVTTFRVQKVWEGLAEDEMAPEITLVLYCNGEVMDKKTPTPDKDGWYIYHNLPIVYKGETAVYTVTEEPLEGFTVSYGEAAEGEEEPTFAEDWGTIVNRKIPKTGDESHIGLWIALTLASACGFIVMMKKRREV